MSTALELPDDVMSAVASRALQIGRPVEDVAAQLLRLALAVDPNAPAEAADAMRRRCEEMTRKFLTGEWGVELAGYEAARAADQRQEADRARAWRD